MTFTENDFRRPVIAAVDGRDVPVGAVFCVGRNYRKHIEELNSRDLGEPLIFTKPASAVYQGSGVIPLPMQSEDMHHEVELAIVVGKKGKNIPESEVVSYIGGAAVALDLTMRDVQAKAKKNGTPWAIAKGFDFSCPISKVHLYPGVELGDLSSVELFLEKNGEMVQHGKTSNMIFSIEYLVSYLSRIFTLNPGDIILTGTPEGVGPVCKGDQLVFWSSFSEKTTLTFD